MIKNLSDAMADQQDKSKQKQKEVKSWGQDLNRQRLNRGAVIKAIAKFTGEVKVIEANVEQMKKQIESDYEKKAKKLAADKSNYEEKILVVKEKYAQEMARKEEVDAELEKCKMLEAECEAKYRDPDHQLRKHTYSITVHL